MEQVLLEKIKKLGIKEFENFNSLNLMDGNYLNIECTLPNGDKTKILDNNTQYYAKQIDIEGSDKCYGVAANEKFIAVYKYVVMAKMQNLYYGKNIIRRLYNEVGH